MVEIIGTVTKIGKIKIYDDVAKHIGNRFSHRDYSGYVDVIHNFKFFMEVQSKEYGIVNAMVVCKAEETNYGYRIPKDEPRQKPFVGDVVKFTTRRLYKNGATWASITFNQTLEIIEENLDARKERQEFIAQKKQEREAEFQKKVEDGKKKAVERKQARLDELEIQKKDGRLPEAVRKEITKTFDLERIIAILRDTTWFTMEEGEGGKRCMHDPPDGCGYPGTGMRRPGGALYSIPESVRKSILSKAIKSGLITKTENGYKATEFGVKLLGKLDICPVCHQLRTPYHGTGHYVIGGRYPIESDLGIRFHCPHEIQETFKHQGFSNCQTTYQDYKNTEKRMKEILEIAKIQEE